MPSQSEIKTLRFVTTYSSVQHNLQDTVDANESPHLNHFDEK